MSNTNITSTGNILAAFAVGALAGAGVALLYAPRSGKETRRIISRRSHDIVRKTGQALKDAQHMARGKQKQFTSAVHAGRNALRRELVK
jgi:gas vesicle protein